MMVYDGLDKEFNIYKLRDNDNSQFYLKKEAVRWAFEYFRYIRKAGLDAETRQQLSKVIDTMKKIKMVKPWEFKDTSFVIKNYVLCYTKRYINFREG